LRRADDDNRRAVEEAAALGADVVVLVCGPPVSRDLGAARGMIEEGIERMLAHAIEHGVRLGIEPLHPMMIGERSAIVTLGEALDMAERIGDPHVGVVIDVYHTFWDPRLESEIARAEGHILGFHVNDWLAATKDTLLERGMMGDGIIDLAGFRAMIDAAGYDGPIEVEILNPAIWDLPRAELMRTTIERFEQCVI
jgi:sugar phosphate isomerase/epimerase